MIEEDIKNESADSELVSHLLQSLRRVEAPGDFEFRVKARVANADASDYRPKAFLPFLRYAMPLGLVLFVGALYALSGLYNPDRQDVPVVAESAVSPSLPAAEAEPAPAVVAKTEIADELPGSPEPVNQSAPEKIAVRRVKNGQANPVKRRETQPVPVGGSVDMAVKGVPKTILPRGLDPDELEVSASGFLTAIGIDAEFGQGGWKVKNVKADSPAERAGIKTGDVVEAIDDRRIDDKTVFKGNFGAKSLKVLRENKQVTLNLKN